jgi:hypothetical protein
MYSLLMHHIHIEQIGIIRLCPCCRQHGMNLASMMGLVVEEMRHQKACRLATSRPAAPENQRDHLSASPGQRGRPIGNCVIHQFALALSSSHPPIISADASMLGASGFCLPSNLCIQI